MRLLLAGGEQGEQGEVGAEEELKEGTQLGGLEKAKDMPLLLPGEEMPPGLAQQEEGDGTVDGEWERGGGAAVDIGFAFLRVADVWWARRKRRGRPRKAQPGL